MRLSVGLNRTLICLYFERSDCCFFGFLTVFLVQGRDLNTSIIEALSPKKCYISAAGNKKHPSGRLVYWLAKYGNVYFTHICNSYMHCQSGTIPNRNGSVNLMPLKGIHNNKL